jgi:hypothetical protein
VLANGGLYNVTVNEQHGTVWQGESPPCCGLAAPADMLCPATPLRFYWAVPPSLFTRFFVRPLIVDGAWVAEVGAKRLMPRVQQWALCIDTTKPAGRLTAGGATVLLRAGAMAAAAVRRLHSLAG